MIKVYFGPYRYSPAEPLTGNETTLSMSDFHMLRGYDRDFWTNNPFVLDQFKQDQIMIWYDGWRTLDETVSGIITDQNIERFSKQLPGKVALMVELHRQVEDHCRRSEATEEQTQKALADIRAALAH